MHGTKRIHAITQQTQKNDSFALGETCGLKMKFGMCCMKCKFLPAKTAGCILISSVPFVTKDRCRFFIPKRPSFEKFGSSKQYVHNARFWSDSIIFHNTSHFGEMLRFAHLRHLYALFFCNLFTQTNNIFQPIRWKFTRSIFIHMNNFPRANIH